MIEKLAERCAIRLNGITSNPNIDTDYVRYRLAELIHTALIFFSVFIIGLLTGKFLESALASLSFYFLRRYTGGFHLKTLEGCALFSISLITLVTYIPSTNPALFTILSIVIVLLLSKRSVFDRILSMAILTSNVILNSDVVAYAFFAQALTLMYKPN